MRTNPSVFILAVSLSVPNLPGCTPEPATGGLPEFHAIRDLPGEESVTSTTEAESRASLAAFVDCSLNPRISVFAFNGETVEALCKHGVTTVSDYRFQYHIFVIGTDNQAYHTAISNATGEGGGWNHLGGSFTSGVFAGEDSGLLQLCAVGSDTVTWNMADYGTGWRNWHAVNVAQCPNWYAPDRFWL